MKESIESLPQGVRGTPAAPLDILVVDDDWQFRELLSAALGEAGHEVRTAEDGPQALALLVERSPDVMLLDIDMPGMNGLEVLRALREDARTARIPVLVLTGRLDRDTLGQAFRMGAHDYLNKPFDLMELQARIGHQVRLKAADDALRQARDELEERVQQRTLQLDHTVGELRAEARERQAAEELLYRNALYDDVTGLPNRALFTDRLDHALRRVSGHGAPQVALLLLDLDRFKVVNESLGHDAGDLVLVETARRLQASLEPADTVARLGGDEFAVLLEAVDDVAEATRVADRIQRELSQPFTIVGQEVFIGASLGIALGSNGAGPGELLRDADTALHRAKAAGRARYHIFDVAMHQRAVDQLRMESDLRRAIDRRELALNYQPIVSLEAGQIGRIIGCEALLRWWHPSRGLVPPLDFIPLAEESGLIVPIGNWVLHCACAQARAWHDEGLPAGHVAVNISAQQFLDPGLVESVARVLADTGLEPAQLQLELTESALMGDPAAARELLQSLKATGVCLAIDDFGTGYSSLAYLKRFPFDTLKVDQSFVRNLHTDRDDQAIVTAVLALARGLRLRVVAEGVETREQLEMLTGQQCQHVQGFLFSHPLPPENFRELLRDYMQVPEGRKDEFWLARLA